MTRSGMRKIAKVLTKQIAAAGASVVCLCPQVLAEKAAPAAAEGPPIKIGVLASMTGTGANAGQNMVNGLNLYFDQIHHQVGNRKIEIVVEDDAGDPSQGIAKFEKLVQKDKVDMINGVVLSNIAYGIAPHTDKYQIPVLLAVSGADDLTKNKRHNWMVRCGYSSSQLAMPFGEYAFKTLGYKRVATIGQNFPFSWETIGGFHKTFEEAGGQIVQKIWTPMDVQDFTPFIKQLTPDVDAVFVCTTINPAIKFLPEFRVAKGKTPLIGAGVNFDETVIKTAPKDALGCMSPQTWSPMISSPANKRFMAAYKAKYKTEASWSAECGYTSGMVIAHALKTVGENVNDRQKFLDALKKVELTDAPRGPVKLDEYGNPIENVYIRKVEEVNGAPENTIAHVYKNVSQFWKYNPAEYLKMPEFRPAYPPCKHCVEKK